MPASHVTRRRRRGPERDSPSISGVESASVHTQSMSGPRPCLIHGRDAVVPVRGPIAPGGPCDPGWSTSAAPPQCATSGRLRSGAGNARDGRRTRVHTRARGRFRFATRERASSSPRLERSGVVRSGRVRPADFGMVARKAGAPRRVRAAAGPNDDRRRHPPMAERCRGGARRTATGRAECGRLYERVARVVAGFRSRVFA
jgi:hypothetical protein